MSLAAFAMAIIVNGSPQEPAVDVSLQYAASYELKPIAPGHWPEDCRVAWTLSEDGAFQATARRKVMTGRWRVERRGGPSEPSSRTVLLIDDLVENGEPGCGVAPPAGRAVLDLMSLANGSLFIVHRQVNADGVPRTSPLARMDKQE